MNYRKRNAAVAVLLSASILVFSGCGTVSSAEAIGDKVNTSDSAVYSETSNDGEVVVDFTQIEMPEHKTESKQESKPESKTESEPESESESEPENIINTDTEAENEEDSDSDEETELLLDGEPEYRKELIKNKDNSFSGYIKVTTGSPVDISWFDDCVFLGDSFTNSLGLYNDSFGELGNAQFVCAACIGWVSSQYDMYHPNEFHPIYNGQKVFLYDAPALTGAKKVVITLGMNDVGCFGIDGTLEAADSFISKVRELTPNVKIYITTVTPMVASAEYDLLNNPLIQQFNERLPEFARQHNCGFLDTWSVFADEDGKLPVELCSDPEGLGFHLNNEGNHILCDFYKANIGG